MNISRYLNSCGVDFKSPDEIKSKKEFKYLLFSVYFWADSWNDEWKREISGDELRADYWEAVHRQNKWMSRDNLPSKRPSESFWNKEYICVKVSGDLYNVKRIVESYCERRFEIVADVFFIKDIKKSKYHILIDGPLVKFVDSDSNLKIVDISY